MSDWKIRRLRGECAKCERAFETDGERLLTQVRFVELHYQLLGFLNSAGMSLSPILHTGISSIATCCKSIQSPAVRSHSF